MNIQLGFTLGFLQRHREALRILRAAIEGASAWPDLVRASLAAQAEVMISQGEFRLAMQALDEAEALGSGDTSERHRVLLARAQALGGAGEPAYALDTLRQAETLPGAEADPIQRFQRANVRAIVLGHQGAWEPCIQAAQEASDLAREAGRSYDTSVSLHVLADALMHLDEHARAYAALRGAQGFAEEVGAERLVNKSRLMLAYLDAVSGSISARTKLGFCLATAEEHKWTADVITGRYLLGRLLAHGGQLQEARREFGLAHQLASSIGHRSLARECALELDRIG